MSYSGAGAFVINSSGQPVVTGTVISSTVFNALTADLATGLSTAICKDGQTATTARIPFAQGVSSTLATDATSTTTGSIITAGGISCVKALWVGGLANIAGALTVAGALSGNTASFSGGSILLGAAPTGSGGIWRHAGSGVLEARNSENSGRTSIAVSDIVASGTATLAGGIVGGFTGTGVYTTFTIVAGVVTAAS